ncbi:hypothetical protein MTR67_007501 [Solanum verrucosum]|uniref:C3H1-type domain-containing protein n=1 Tax=Solanum verrucosum TaxID=315347 RepID=A0AAF0Q007_SOLVR|nr:hypothetical protein MTR67_007501 [Solanum verrucosum]
MYATDPKSMRRYKLGFCPNGPDCRYRHAKMPGPPPPVEEILQKIQHLASYNYGYSNRFNQNRNANYSTQTDKSQASQAQNGMSLAVKSTATETPIIQQHQPHQQVQPPQLQGGPTQAQIHPNGQQNQADRTAVVLPQGTSREKYGTMAGRWRSRNNITPYGCGLWRSIRKGWKWETLTLSRKQGGLGKYGLFSQWTTEEVMGSFGCCVWKTIRRLWPHFNNNIYISVGNGLKTNFWNEIWKGDDSLRNLFPNLYTLSLQRSATVAQVWSQQGWNLVFRRALNDWEIEDVARLLEVLNTPPAISQRKDEPIWKLHSKGMFTVKSCYWRINVNQFYTTFLIINYVFHCFLLLLREFDALEPSNFDDSDLLVDLGSNVQGL